MFYSSEKISSGILSWNVLLTRVCCWTVYVCVYVCPYFEFKCVCVMILVVSFTSINLVFVYVGLCVCVLCVLVCQYDCV